MARITKNYISQDEMLCNSCHRKMIKKIKDCYNNIKIYYKSC